MKRVQNVIQNWYFFIVVAVVVFLAEFIGMISIPMPIGSIMFFPLLYAMVMMLLLYLIKGFKPVGKKQEQIADTFVILGITVFIAKVSIASGVALPQVIEAGPALLLQELGNLGTIFIAMPIALLLGFKREAVGMTHSIAREPNVGIIANKYGLDSPEGEGVIMIYVVGTLIGTIFMGILASVLATATPLHPLALAMATGVGSGSMMAASSAPLMTEFPDMATEIQAFAATSNVLSTADTIIVTFFIGLPLCNWLYKVLEPKLGKGRSLKGKASIENRETAVMDDPVEVPADVDKKLSGDKVGEMLLAVIITAVIALIGNWIWLDGWTAETTATFGPSVIGICILAGIAIAGNLLGTIIPGKIPAVIWITVIGILLAMPWNPMSVKIVEYVNAVQMLPLATPILAYAGVTMGKNWADFKRIGWRGIVVAVCVMFGTFVGSAIIAQIILSATGVI